MPAVAFVIPPNSESGHPASSTVSRYEQFLRRLIGKVQDNQALWEKSAILVTVDESGGYWDSGSIRGRHAHPIDRGLALCQERRGRPHLYRPRFDPQIHRGELAPRAVVAEKPRPSAEHLRPLCPGQPFGDRRSDEPLCFLSSGPGGLATHSGSRRKDCGDRSVWDCISYARSPVRDAVIDGGSGPDNNLDGGFP